jgi:hypothetical protein
VRRAVGDPGDGTSTTRALDAIERELREGARGVIARILEQGRQVVPT